MSRIGKQILTIPAGVEVKLEENNLVTVKSSKGSLAFNFNPELKINIEEAQITVERPNETKNMKAIHGTTTALIKNMLTGVTDGFSKTLELNGVGYRAALQGKVLNLSLGFSHPVNMDIPEGLTVEVPSNTEIIISGMDKQLVGEFAANVRKNRKPEPYKGKGIKYKDEVIRRKEGKRAGK
ncbi:MAG: 50S ribosomal protein L6 [Mycoplasmatales bacterium]